MTQLEELLAKRRAALRHPRRHALEREAVGQFADARREPGRCRSAAPSAARCCSTICIRAMPAMSASARTRSSPRYIKQADLVLLVGGRMGEMPSSDYTLLKSPYPDQTLVHVHPDAGELGRVYRPTLAINASPAAFAEAFAGRKPASAAGLGRRDGDAARRLSRLVDAARNRARRGADGADHELSGKRAAGRRHHRPTAPATTPPGSIASTASAASPRRRAPTSGSMGYGTPAAVAAKAALSRTATSSPLPATAAS